MTRLAHGPLERADLTMNGVAMVRLYGGALDLATDPGRWLGEHLGPCPQGALVAVVGPHVLLAHPIRDRTALDAVPALAAAAQQEGARHPEIHHWHSGALSTLALVERSGRTCVDPRDANLVDRIESLPPPQPSLEDEALGGSERAASVLAARAWKRGAVDEADRWYARLQEEVPTAALGVAWVLVEDYLEAVDDRPVDEAVQEADFATAARWLQRCARREDRVARMVCDAAELRSGDFVPRWAWAIADVARVLNRTVPQAERDRTGLPVGPAELGIDDVEDILAVLREHGGEPSVTSIGRTHSTRVVDLAAQAAPALRELYLESMDGDVAVALRPSGSWVAGPTAAAARVQQITEARRRVRVAFGEPALWARALFPSGMYMLAPPVSWLLATADGEYERAAVPYLVLLEVALVIFVGWRLLTQPQRDERARGRGTLRTGGPVRIKARGPFTRT